MGRVTRIQVRGECMSPAIPHGSTIFVVEREPCRGDAVAFRAGGRVQLKRVKGVAGDALGPDLPVPAFVEAQAIPAGMLYVSADAGSYGSARYGLIGVDSVIGCQTGGVSCSEF